MLFLFIFRFFLEVQSHPLSKEWQLKKANMCHCLHPVCTYYKTTRTHTHTRVHISLSTVRPYSSNLSLMSSCVSLTVMWQVITFSIFTPNVFPQVRSNGTAISLKSAEKYERYDLVTIYFLHPSFFYRHLFSTQGCTQNNKVLLVGKMSEKNVLKQSLKIHVNTFRWKAVGYSDETCPTLRQ